MEFHERRMAHQVQSLYHPLGVLPETRWAVGVPLALVSSPTASDEQSYPVADEESLWQTKAGANAVAKKLAIEWIDSQFPTAAD